MSRDPRWDVLLVNAVAALLADPFHDRELVARDLSMINEALAQAPAAATPAVAELRAACAVLIDVHARREAPGGDWAWARVRVGSEAAKVVRWRAAQLHGILTAPAEAAAQPESRSA